MACTRSGLEGSGGRAIPAVMCTVWLDAAAFGTLVDHLTRFQLQALNKLLGGISLGHGALQYDTNTGGTITAGE